jgi:uncharacterized protein YndB with AHSA1/START domain
MTDTAKVAAPERTLVVSRVFDAPRDVVYRAWTDPKQVAQWFPPKDFTAPVCEVDARPGGVFRIVMKAPPGEPLNGAEFPGEGKFTEVVPNERIAFTFAGEGNVPPPLLMTVLFEAQGHKTKVTVRQETQTVEAYQVLVKTGASEGLNESFDKLADLLRSLTQTKTDVRGRTLTLTRLFDAPRELVWTAYTDPKHLTKWMFANNWESNHAETDLRPGGAFKIGMRPSDGSDVGFDFSGTYREIKKPERIVQVVADGRVMTTTFADEGGKTRLTLTLEMAVGEEQERGGWSQILEHLAQHLATA